MADREDFLRVAIGQARKMGGTGLYSHLQDYITEYKNLIAKRQAREAKKKKPAPKKKIKIKVKKKKPAPKKIPVSKFTYKNLAEPNDDMDEDLLWKIVYQLEEDARDLGSHYDYSFIIGVSERQDEFYTENFEKGFQERLSAKKQARGEKIRDKIETNMPKTVRKYLKQVIKEWKQENKGKEFTQKQAENSVFEKYFSY